MFRNVSLWRLWHKTHAVTEAIHRHLFVMQAVVCGVRVYKRWCMGLLLGMYGCIDSRRYGSILPCLWHRDVFVERYCPPLSYKEIMSIIIM